MNPRQTSIPVVAALLFITTCTESGAQSPIQVPAVQNTGNTVLPVVQPQTPLTVEPSNLSQSLAVPHAVSPGAFSGAGAIADSPSDSPDNLYLEHGDSLEETQPNKWSVVGHVKMRYRGYIITGDRLDVDTVSGDATFTGQTTLKTPYGQTVNSNPNGSLTINVRSNTYVIRDATTIIDPQALPIGIILPLRISGGTITGTQKLIDARGSTFTTCDFIKPHYYFQARQLVLIPGSRLIARDVTLFRKNRRLFTLPYLYVPLDERLRRQTIFPLVGHSADEGFFAKFAFGYAISSALPGILRIDLLQKKGIGTGFEQDYGDARDPSHGAGNFTIYHLRDKSTGNDNLSGSLSHNQHIGIFDISLGSQFQNNSYYAGNTKSQASNDRLSITQNSEANSFSLQTTLNNSNYGFGKSQSLSSALSEAYTTKRQQHIQTTFNYSDFLNPSSPPNRRLDSALDITSPERLGTFELLANKFTNLSPNTGQAGFFYGTEKLPELRFTTDPQHLGIRGAYVPQSARFDLSVGQFNEPSSKVDTNRVRFNLDSGSTTWKLAPKSTLEAGTTYQQGFYGDGTAQYVLAAHLSFMHQIGAKSRFNTFYSYLRPYGFTPFQFDFIGSNNNIISSLLLTENRHFHISLGTGYDINAARNRDLGPHNPWQNLAIQMLVTPSDKFVARLSSAYDINHGLLQDVIGQFQLRPGGGTALNISSRYASTLHKISSISGDLDLPFARDLSEDAGWRLQAIAGYNGFTNKFEYRGVALTRDWHDWRGTLKYEESTLGFNSGAAITFNFSLKAFPSYEPFGIGQFGQSLNTGVGDVY